MASLLLEKLKKNPLLAMLHLVQHQKETIDFFKQMSGVSTSSLAVSGAWPTVDGVLRQFPSLAGCKGSSIPFLLLAYLQQRPKVKNNGPLFLLLPKKAKAQEIAADLRALLAGGVVSNPPVVYTFEIDADLPYSPTATSPTAVESLQRFYSLAFMPHLPFEKDRDVVVVVDTVFALQAFDRYEEVAKRVLTLEVGSQMPPSQLRQQLEQLGYQRVMRVENPGEYAHRGELFDLYTPAYAMPLRLYFFGDDLEEVRRFHASTQSSLPKSQLKKVLVFPFANTLVDQQQLLESKKLLETYYRQIADENTADANAENSIKPSNFENSALKKNALVSSMSELLEIVTSLEKNGLQTHENFNIQAFRKHLGDTQGFDQWLSCMKATLWIVDEACCREEVEKLLLTYGEARKELVGEAGKELVGEAGKELVGEARKELVGEARKELVGEAGKELVGEAGKELVGEARKELVGKARKELVASCMQESTEDKPIDKFLLEPTAIFPDWGSFVAVMAKTSILQGFLATSGFLFDQDAETMGAVKETEQTVRVVEKKTAVGKKEAKRKRLSLAVQQAPVFKKKLSAAKAAVEMRLARGEAVCLLSANVFAQEKLREIFVGEQKDQASKASSKKAVLAYPQKALDEKGGGETKSDLPLTSGFYSQNIGLSSGFSLAGLHVWTDLEMFGKTSRVGMLPRGNNGDSSGSGYSQNKVAKGDQTSTSVWLDSYFDLNEDDFVVHQSHGIGVFRGLAQIKVEDSHKDYLKIEYAEKSFLFVPMEQLSLVQKYVGGKPKIDRLGGSAWEKLKKRVIKNTENLARQLISLYSQRSYFNTTPFIADDFLQTEFEMQFPYEETVDQLKAIAEIKKDLQSEKVMDRLLCADVGFGKTEVALRAVFKAVMSGFQVAFLVPTTILSSQHFRNFLERFADYPVSIELLNRFVAKKQKDKVVAGLASGEIDIVVATHKLFAKEISFKKLGLLVIDEEQKFGVKQKESLKKKYPYVNTLSLSATPIPRTLHMSLSGVRDLSVIATPPHGRKEVDVHILRYDAGVLRSAVLGEKKRGGQVFFVCPRIVTLETLLVGLKKMFPEISIASVHGKMLEEEMTPIMNSFIKGEIDLLASTAIIESGLDIPNANTLLVYDSHVFGLSQLYQLKGRVGRSKTQASAYFFYPNKAVLRGSAKKRLESLGESTRIGAGFSLAMRDLEIRGAGNLLGPQQSGSIAAVGYEMYCKLLAQSFYEQADSDRADSSSNEKETGLLKRESSLAFAHLPTSVDVKYDGILNNEYAGGAMEKIKLFRQISTAETDEKLSALKDAIKDRFGPMPSVVEKLLAISALRIAAAKRGVLSVVEKSAFFEIVFNPAAKQWADNKKRWQKQLLKRSEIQFVPDKDDRIRLLKQTAALKAAIDGAKSAGEKKRIAEQFFREKLQKLQFFFSQLK